MPTERGTLAVGEPHPSAHNAYRSIMALGLMKQSMYLEAFSSCALSGDRTSEILGETLNRILTGQPVSDRYVLGLAWALMEMEGAE